MKNPFVSVVIPAFNEEKNIKRCLDFIKSQNYPADCIDLTIVDKQSVDNTTKIGSDYGVAIISVPEGTTIAQSRNIGWKSSIGEYVAFLDADCLPSENWLSNSIQLLESSNKIIAVTGTIILDPECESISWVERIWIEGLSSKKANEIEFVSTLASFAFVLSRKTLEKVEGFNESLVTCEDSDLGYRLSELGAIAQDSRVRVVHLGNAKKISDFFKRQLWQGRSNLANFFMHKVSLDELPSLLIPPLFVLLLLVPFVFLFMFQSTYFLIFSIMGLCLPSMVVFSKKKCPTLINFIQSYCIWFLYLLARGIGFFFSRVHPKKDIKKCTSSPP